MYMFYFYFYFLINYVTFIVVPSYILLLFFVGFNNFFLDGHCERQTGKAQAKLMQIIMFFKN